MGDIGFDSSKPTADVNNTNTSNLGLVLAADSIAHA